VVEAARQFGAPERCVFVVASAAASAALQWIAPFAGFTIGEYFRDRGGHALVIVDDLTKHAATHRELALLTREPPGREAFPADIFYVHARLLERAAKLSPELGGGSLTALPIAETDAGNLSAFIPTNLISITDGQIVLDSRLFAANQRPAVDVGLSVSRVGGKAQAPALRAASGRLRLDYSQFLELELFTRFGGIADTRVRATIVRGERIRAALAQPRFATLRLVDQVALLSALSDGVFDGALVAKVGEARARVTAQLDALAPETVVSVMATGSCGEADTAKSSRRCARRHVARPPRPSASTFRRAQLCGPACRDRGDARHRGGARPRSAGEGRGRARLCVDRWRGDRPGARAGRGPRRSLRVARRPRRPSRHRALRRARFCGPVQPARARRRRAAPEGGRIT
jgi:F-type H+-transporting ATPase subunit alpha